MAVAERIVSLLPSATEIVCALGLAHHLVGVSHSCDHPPLIRSKPRLTRARFPLDGLSSGEMDAAVRQALREFGSVYEVDNERLAAVAPDLLLTQGVCEVCAVPTRDAEAAALALVACPTVLALDAHDITGVLATIRLVGHAGGVPWRHGPFGPVGPTPSTPRRTSAVPGRASRTVWSCWERCSIPTRSQARRSRGKQRHGHSGTGAKPWSGRVGASKLATRQCPCRSNVLRGSSWRVLAHTLERHP